MIGSLIGAGIGAIGSIFGSISAAKAARKAKEGVEQDKRDNQNWYDRRYNEDATQRADAQRILTALSDTIRSRNKAAAGTQAVMGGTEESVAAEKEANSKAMAAATSEIAAAGERRKDQIENQYLQTKKDLNKELRNIETGRASAVQSAGNALLGAGLSLGSSIDEYIDSKKAQ